MSCYGNKLNNAAQSSQYFSKILSEASPKEWVQNPQLWCSIPLMNKRILLSNFDSICTDKNITYQEVDAYLKDKLRVDDPYHLEEYLVVSTAGTMGKPGYFVYNQQEQSHIRAQYFRFMNAVLRTFELSEPLRTAAIIMTGSHMIGYKMQRNLPSQFFKMIPVMENGKPVTVEEMANKLEEFKPHVITCFGTTLRMLTDYKEDNPKFSWQPKAIISTGATIESDVKKRAESAFIGAKVFDLYGSTDTGYIAWTCEEGEMHINTDCFHIEVLDQAHHNVTSGQMGSIVLTPYWQRTLPLVRYELGDLIELGGPPCRCRRTLPTVKRLLGRENTLLYRKNQENKEKLDSISQGVIMQIFETTSGVKKFRIVQENLDSLSVELVPSQSDHTLIER
jgi:phenylacetate-CoA ligase